MTSHLPFRCRFTFQLRLLVLALLLPCALLRAEDSSAAPQKNLTAELIGNSGRSPAKWKEQWAKDTGDQLTQEAQVALKVATHPELNRTRLRTELNTGADTLKAAARNLDIGRHDLLKALLTRSCERANTRLRNEGLSPLTQATTVNSGGTGDYTRDVDLTVFGGDSLRETYLFEAILEEAASLGLKCDPDPRHGVKAGLNFPQLEVAFHRGNNDLPDMRFSSDVQSFAADYKNVINNQAQNPEAYFGYGFEVEVQGRRSLSFKPGQTMVQEFICEEGKPVQYRGQIASCQREVRAILLGSIGQRYRRAQNSSHITNHYLQACRHEQGSDHDLSKGALKYAGRSVEALCDYYGMKNWPDLVLEDRVALLKHLFPDGYGNKPNERATLEHMAESLDVAYLTFLGKAVPKAAGGKEVSNAERDAEMCMRFMQKAVATTTQSVAEEMLHPPSFDPRFLEEAARRSGKTWDLMNAKERNTFAMQADDNYRRCCSVAAMENLLCMVQQVRQLDIPEFNNKGDSPGKTALEHMLDSADEVSRPILELAIDHAEAAVAIDSASDPIRKKAAEQRLKAYRRQMESITGLPSAGETLIEKASKLQPSDYVTAIKTQKPYPLGEDVALLRRRFSDHIAEAFPPTDIAGFRAHLKEVGAKSYVLRKMTHEIASPATAMDVINLIEIYQNGGGKTELAKAAGLSLVNRGHWSLGFLFQAGSVRTEKDLEELGKNVVFETFARLVPGAGQIKLIFDIEKGLVNITVGYTFNQLNADLIDALYTGEAGRLKEGTAGTVAGKLRDSGFCILDPVYLKKETDPKTKVQSIVLDKVALYEASFERFTGRNPYETSVPTADRVAGQVTRAHDGLLNSLDALAASQEPSWFGRSTELKPTNEMLQNAMTAYYKALEAFTGPAARKVLSESAARTFVKEGKDQIEEGLIARYTQDILNGTLAAWQTRQIERTQARREVEASANFADMNQFAVSLAKQAFEARTGESEPPDYTLEVRLPGSSFQTVMDGGVPVPMRLSLKSYGETPIDMGDVFYVVEPGALSKPKNGRSYEPGEVFTQEYKAKALSGEECLAEKAFTLKIRVPEGKQELKLLTYEEKDRQGNVRESYSYYDRDTYLKSGQKSAHFSGNKLLHGTYSEYNSRGQLVEEITYSLGRKNGTSKRFSGAYLSSQTEFVMDRQVKFTAFYPDGTKKWEQDYDDKGGLQASRSYWGVGDKVMESVRIDGSDGEGLLSGLFQSFWDNGNQGVRSAFVGLSPTETINDKTILRFRHGPWLSLYKNGKVKESGQCERGKMRGRWEYFNESGQAVRALVYDAEAEIVEDEVWTYWENGTLKEHKSSKERGRVIVLNNFHQNGKQERHQASRDGELEGLYSAWNDEGIVVLEGSYNSGAREGLWVEAYADGKPKEKALYSKGEYNGEYISYWSNGKTQSRGLLKSGLREGKWEFFRETGTHEMSGSCAANRRQGVWVFYDQKGKRSYWQEFRNDEVLRQGSYDD